MNYHNTVVQCALLLASLAAIAPAANRGTSTGQPAGTPSSETSVFRGIVLDPNGRPQSDVTVSLLGLPLPNTNTTTDAKGTFELRTGGLGRRYRACTVARSATRNLAAAVRFDPDAKGPLTIKLAPGEILSGRVTDAKGKRIPAAEIFVILMSDSQGWTLPQSVGTDPNGRYEILAVPEGYVYSVHARAQGYGEVSARVGTSGVREDRIEAQPLTLLIANLDISGIVVDANDKPVPNTNIMCAEAGTRLLQGRADAQGRFTIHGFCAATVQVNAFGPSSLRGSVQTTGGATGVKVVIRRTSSGDPNTPAKAPPLMAKPLPSIAEFGIEPASDSFKGRPIVVCFFDAGQRPSRNTLTTLAKQVDGLKAKGVAVIAVRVTDADGGDPTPWLKEQSAVLPIGSVKADAAKTKLTWGIQGLPWLILADTNHIVRAEGFAIDDLGEILQRTK